MGRLLDTILALLGAVAAALILGTVAYDGVGLPRDVIGASAIGGAGLILAAVACGSLMRPKRSVAPTGQSGDIMPFAIQWTGSLGPATTERNTSVEAIRYALELLGKGFADVVIIDLAEDGKAYAPYEFAQLYKQAGK